MNWLTPKIPWDQKLVDCSSGSLCKDVLFFFQFFLLNEWTTYFTSFPLTPNMSNSDSVWARGEVLFKMGIRFIFLVSSKELLHATMSLKLPKDWKAGSKEKVCFAHRILVFHFFSLFFLAHGSTWCHLLCNC
jgi:hypothetical protein